MPSYLLDRESRLITAVVEKGTPFPEGELSATELATYTFPLVIKCLTDKCNLRKKWSVRAHGLRGWSPCDREGTVEVTGHTVCAIRKQTAMNAGVQLAFSFFPRTSAHGMALSIFRVGLPSSVKSFWGYPQAHTQSCVSS